MEKLPEGAYRGSAIALWAITTDGYERGLAVPGPAPEPEQPEEACRRAADAGRSQALEALAERRSADPHWAQLLRYGLEPDGRTSTPWS
ncbi:hypothetical protein PUR71_04290 [Streptomyces sp. SP17BM10]|uniref:hypothetical protein n=1 Tax=Streptomyces sp. SP17BM10 TaxID=3002530 RepID=UPI002E766C7B|nr:hypothetical protein [Streptomyces sp. SP17BM10]MEE1782150.1 hypothetical protein [Streptomyces sp. SP17BM10]